MPMLIRVKMYGLAEIREYATAAMMDLIRRRFGHAWR